MIAYTEPAKENAAGQSGVSAATKLHNPEHIASSAERKRFATMRAQFALRGHVFYETTTTDGKPLFIATQYALCRELSSLEEAENFLVKIGGIR